MMELKKLSDCGPNRTALKNMARYQRLPLGYFPTPVSEVKLQSGETFWMKEDGACSDVYGGNKVRKLEYFLAEARNRKAVRIIVQGGTKSHTAIACVLHSLRVGFDVTAVLYPPANGCSDRTVAPLIKESGAEIMVKKSFLAMNLSARIISLKRGSRLVPIGCTTPLTTLGYVKAGLELSEQVAEGLLPEPDTIFLAHATGGTLAGLLIGLVLGGCRSRVAAIQTVEPIFSGKGRLFRLIDSTVGLISGDRDLALAARSRLARLDDRYLGEGYFSNCPESVKAVSLMDELGVSLEPVFTGKAMAALLEEVRSNRAGNVLFWNTHDMSNGNLACKKKIANMEV